MRSTRDPSPPRKAGMTRAASGVLRLTLLQGGFAVRRRFRERPVVSYTTFSPLPRLTGAVCSLWHFPLAPVWRRPPGLNNRAPCPVESGLSSPEASQGRPVALSRYRKIVSHNCPSHIQDAPAHLAERQLLAPPRHLGHRGGLE